MAAPVVASYATGTASSGSSMSLAAPSGVADGDYLLLASAGSKFNTAPTISGFTNRATEGTTGSSGHQSAVADRIADSEPGTYTVTLGGLSASSAVILARITGATASPLDGSVSSFHVFNGSDTASKTTTGDDELAIAITSLKGGSAPTPTGESWAQEASVGSAGIDNSFLAMFSLDVPSPATISASSSSVNHLLDVFLLALKSPPPPPPTPIDIPSPAAAVVVAHVPRVPVVIPMPAMVSVTATAAAVAIGVPATTTLVGANTPVIPLAITAHATVAAAAPVPAIPLAIPAPATVSATAMTPAIGVRVPAPVSVGVHVEAGIIIPIEVRIEAGSGKVGEADGYGPAWSDALAATAFESQTPTSSASLPIGRVFAPDTNYYLCELWAEFDTSAIPASAQIVNAQFQWELGSDASVGADTFILRKASWSGAAPTSSDWPFHGLASGSTLASYAGGQGIRGYQVPFETLDPQLGITKAGTSRYVIYSDAYATAPTGDASAYVHVARVSSYSNPTLRILYVPPISVAATATVVATVASPIIAVAVPTPTTIRADAVSPAIPVTIPTVAAVSVTAIPAGVAIAITVDARVTASVDASIVIPIGVSAPAAQMVTTFAPAVPVVMGGPGSVTVTIPIPVVALVIPSPSINLISVIAPASPAPPASRPYSGYTAELTAALRGQYGTVRTEFRFTLRTSAYAYIADLTPWVVADSAHISLNNDRTVRRQMEMTLDASRRYHGAALDLDVMRAHVAPAMRIHLPGRVLGWPVYVDVPMGLFQMTWPTKTIAPRSMIWDVDCSDLTMQLTQDGPSSPYTVAAGSDYLTVVASILTTLGLRHTIVPSGIVTPSARTWSEPGTSWQQIINDLLSAANYYAHSFDSQGVAWIRKITDLNSRPADQTYGADDAVLAPWREQGNLNRFANRVVVSSDDPNTHPMYSVATNADPDNAVSTISLGRTITKFITVSSTATQAILDARASSELQQAAAFYRTANLLTVPDPLREPGELYRIDLPDASDGELWQVRDWDLALKPAAQMKHTLSRVEKLVAS